MSDKEGDKFGLWRQILPYATAMVLVVVAGAAFVLFMRLRALEERFSFIEPHLDVIDRNTLELQLSISELSQRTAARRTPAKTPEAPRNSGKTAVQSASSARPVPSGNRNTQPSRTQPAIRQATSVRRTELPASPDALTSRFVGLLSSAANGMASRGETMNAYRELLKRGETVVESLLLSLNDLPEDDLWSRLAYDAIEELATQQHKDMILQLFDVHEELAGTIAALNLQEAAPMILIRLREGGQRSPELLRAVATLKLTDGYPLIGLYAVRMRDPVAVEILTALPEGDYNPSSDLIRIIANRDEWNSPEEVAIVRKAATNLMKRGNRAGLDFFVAELANGEMSTLDSNTSRALRRYVEYTGSNRDFPVWLQINAADLTWSARSKRFVMP